MTSRSREIWHVKVYFSVAKGKRKQLVSRAPLETVVIKGEEENLIKSLAVKSGVDKDSIFLDKVEFLTMLGHPISYDNGK